MRNTISKTESTKPKELQELQEHKNMNTYKIEKLKDYALSEIKSTCLKFLEDRSSVYLEQEHIEICTEMINNELNAIKELKENLKIQDYYSPFYELFNTFDGIIIDNAFLKEISKPAFLELTKDINYLLSDLEFCKGILNLMLQYHIELKN